MEEAFNLYQRVAKYYDYDNRDNLTDDIPFYLEYAQKTGKQVLELGAGTGRVAIPLAQAGFQVVGLDLSDSMLAFFEEKRAALPEPVKNRLKLVKGDMSQFAFDEKFDLIIAPFRAFQSLTEEAQIHGSLRCIAAHLKETGLFIINVFRPHSVLDEGWCYPETVQWETVDQKEGLQITKKHWGSRIDVAQQVIYPCFAYEIRDRSGQVQRLEEKLSLKYYYEPQLEFCLAENGFEIKESYGWYDKSSLANGRELIYICQKRRQPHE